MLKKLKIKFLAINMFLVFLVFCMTFSFIYAFHCRTVEMQTLKQLENVINLSISDFVEMAEKTNSESKVIQSTPIFIATVSPSDGKIYSMLKSNVSFGDDILSTAVYTAINSPHESGEIKDLRLRYLKKTSYDSIKIAFIDIGKEYTSKHSLLVVLGFSGVLALIAFFLMGLALSSIALKPVSEAWTSQKQFIADASHELKTPLTVILANIDILENNQEQTIYSQKKWIQGSKQVALQMKNLIEEMLFLAKSDAGKQDTHIENFNVSDTLISRILFMEAVAYEKNVVMNYENVSHNLYAKGDEKQLSRLFTILIDNACKYSYENTSITYRLKKEQDKIKFSINNMGDTLSKKDTKNIFERFYRIDKSRNKENGGYGLGLAIAKRIADSNNMRLWVESDQKSGTTFFLIMQATKT